MPDRDRGPSGRELAAVRAEQAFHLRHFAGRERTLALLRDWIDAHPVGGMLLVTGPPGAGKSAVLAALAAQEQARGGCILHMARSHADPRRFVPALVAQAARLLELPEGPGPGERDSADEGDLGNALVAALESLVTRFGRAVLVLDGLDELRPADVGLALPVALPEGARVVASARPDLELLGRLRARVPWLEEHALPPLGLDDVTAIVAAHEPARTAELDPVALAERAAGNALVLEHLIAAGARRGLAAAATVPAATSLPGDGLEAVFAAIWREISAADAEGELRARGLVRGELLALLSVAHDALGLEDLAALASLGGRELGLEACREAVAGMSAYLVVSADGRVRPWHRGLVDWVRARQLGEAGVLALEERFCTWLAAPAPGRQERAYALSERLGHLCAAGRVAEAASLACDPSFLEARLLGGRLHELVADLADVLAALEGTLCDAAYLLGLVREILQRHAAFLVRHPRALFQIVHQAGRFHDAADAAEHLAPLERGDRGAVATPDPTPAPAPAPGRLAAWIADWERARAVPASRHETAPWVRSHRPPPVRLGSSLLAVLHGHEGEVIAVGFSPTGTALASAGTDGTVRLWDVRSGAERAAVTPGPGRALAVAFAPDGRRIAVGGDDGLVRLWLAPAVLGAEVAGAEPPPLVELARHDGPVWALAFAPDGRTLASGGRDGTVRVTRRDGTEAWRAELGGTITALAFSGYGRRLGAAAARGRIAVWGAGGEPVLDLGALEETPWSLDLGASGERLLWTDAGGSVHHVDADGAHAEVLRLPDERLWAGARAPDGRSVVVGGTGKTLYRWVPGGGERSLAEIGRLEGAVNSLAFSPDGTRVASGAADGTVRIWRTSPGPAPRRLRGDVGRVRALAFDGQGRRLAVGGHDGRLQLWDAATGRVVVERTLEPGPVTALAFAASGQLLAVGSQDGRLRVLRADGRERACLRAHDAPVTAVAFRADGSQLVSGSLDESVRIFSLLGQRELARLPLDAGVARVAVSADGTRVAACGRRAGVRVWELAQGALRVRHDGPFDAEATPALEASGLAFAADGSTLVLETQSGVRLGFDLDTGERRPVPAAPEPGWRAVSSGGEVAIVPRAGGAPVAWYLASVEDLVASPTGRTWAARAHDYVHLFTLEGVLEAEGG